MHTTFYGVIIGGQGIDNQRDEQSYENRLYSMFHCLSFLFHVNSIAKIVFFFGKHKTFPSYFRKSDIFTHKKAIILPFDSYNL